LLARRPALRFASGRDGIDILAFVGASVRATESLRIGAEYVGQDLEDAFEHQEAEGGARHFAAAVGALELADGAFWVTLRSSRRAPFGGGSKGKTGVASG
jgi:hypothetical protein